MNKSRLLGAVCAFSISMLVSTAHAAIVYYEGTLSEGASDGNGAWPVIRTSGGGHSYTQGFTIDIGIGLDTDTNELWYTKYTFSAPALTLTFTDQVTVGIGEVVDIATTLNIDSVQSALSGPTERLSLTPLAGGVFEVEYPPLSTTREPIIISGDYSSDGPTESASGTFSAPIYTYNRLVYRHKLDTISFPGSVTLENGTAGGWQGLVFHDSPYPVMFSETIDGVQYEALAQNYDFFSNSDITLTPSTVPIPPALWLFGSGLLGLVGIARRKKTS